MRFFAAGASLFLVFIAVGNAIKCEVCRSLKKKDCSGAVVTCAKNVKGCQTALLVYDREGSDPIRAVLKNCSALSTKNAMFRSAVSHGLFQLRVEVCQTNNCNKTPLQLPPMSKTLNGVKCPNCNVTGDLTCEADGVVECVGEMTNCIFMAATYYSSGSPPIETDAYRGCTSAKSTNEYPRILSSRVQDIETLEISNGV